MTWIDYTLPFVLVGAGFAGYQKGLIGQIASLVGFVVAFLFATPIAEVLRPSMGQWLSLTAETAFVPSYVFSFLLILLLCLLIGRLLRNILQAVSLGWLDRWIGATFGIVKWLFLLGLVFLTIESIDPNGRIISAGTKERSICYKATMQFTSIITPLVEQHLSDNE